MWMLRVMAQIMHIFVKKKILRNVEFYKYPWFLAGLQFNMLLLFVPRDSFVAVNVEEIL